MSRNSLLLKIFLPLLILALGAAGMAALILRSEAPPRETPRALGALVEVVKVERADHRVRVTATGTVQPRHETSITPQVSGRVTRIDPQLVAGGLFRAGQLLFAVEDTDYRLAVERAQASLARAELDVRTVEGQARVARSEWQRLDLSENGEPSPLVFFEPQLASARAALVAAGAQLEQARLDLERTRLHAPFNALVRSAQVEQGQFLHAAGSVATLIGTERAEVVVPLPLAELGVIQVPRPGGTQPGAPAKIRLSLGEKRFAWQGRVVRSLGEVDPRGRMARVVVEVSDPYNLQDTWPADQPSLDMGLFVEVEIEGEVLAQVVRIPRDALRENEQVWVAAQDDSLRIKPVEILRREEQTLLIGAGLEPGERLILTPLMGAAEGMQLRPRPQGAATP